jgi:ABC-2 type transport system permease protein
VSVLAIAGKELELYFTSFLFYALAAVFLALAGYFFYTNLGFFVLMGGMNLPRGLWQWQFLELQRLLLGLVPLLTMRLFAEERKLGTLELLWTYPVRDAEIIAGKFLACLAVVTAMIAATAAYLLAAAFVACGLFLSALTESQLVAASATYGVLLFFWVLTWNEAAMNEGLLRFLVQLSLFDRFHAFTVGAIDTENVSYLVLFTLAFLGFTFLALDARRWRGLR